MRKSKVIKMSYEIVTDDEVFKGIEIVRSIS